MLLHARSRDLLSCIRQALRGVRHVVCDMSQVAGSGWRAAELMTSVEIIVWILSLAQPPQRNLTMPHDHGVDNCSLRFSRNGRELDLGESRSPTQIVQRNLRLASHGLWAYVCAFGPGLLVMMVMVMMVMVMMAMVMMEITMMVMVMVSVPVIIVPEALRQVGWHVNVRIKASTDLEASTSQSFHRLRVCHRPKASRG